MTDWNAVSAFMTNVVAWPGTQADPGFVNLHYSMPNIREPAKGLLKGMGWPFRSVDELVNRAAWINTVPDKFRDVWFCTSLQSTAGKNARGNPKAVRLAANALKQKAIWIDVDVDADPKHYSTVEEALKAVLPFATTVGLPTPSAIVYSGSGLHVYWISKDALSPAEWLPYASGLKQLLLANAIKCDTGLTTDIARILRVPGTFNHKYDPPKPVTLAPLPLVMYDFKKLDFLKGFAAPAPAAPAQGPSLFAEGVTRASFGELNPAFDALKGTPDLNAGIDKGADQLLDPFPIFRECGFLRHALVNGGKDYNQTLWMYSVLCSTFMENGNDIAHRISKDHAEYTAVDTQALYDRKMAERHDRGIGYPSCATIAGAGSEACKTCPLFPKGKSPLNIRPKPPVTAAVTPGVQSPQAAALSLPNGFELNGDGIICKIIESEQDGEVTTQMVPLFQAVLSGFWLQKQPGEHLNFTCTVDKGFTEQVSVSIGDIGVQGFVSILLGKRVLIDTRGERFLKEFFLSTIGKLRAAAAAQQTIPFGWFEQDGKIRGFAYGGKVFKDDGTEQPCGVADPTLIQSYTPTGDINEWFKACRTVTDRKRPELSSIMLMAFASPLLALNGRNTAVLSAYGRDSGAGKSSAYTVGMSVWGHPLGTKVTEQDTPNSIASRMKVLRNLPFYWDEIVDPDMRKKFKTVMHQLDGGKEKSRMKDGERHQAIGTFQLMLHYASNESLVDFLRQDNVNTVASQMRVLEWEVKRVDGGPGHMPDADAQMLLAACNRNFGRIGEQYAKFLGMNHVAITEEFRKKCNEVQAKTGGGNSERYWYTTVAVMTLAAKYAQMLGVDVDPVDIEQFMYKVYTDNITDREEYAAGGDLDNGEVVLTRYLKERDFAERGIWTDHMHNTQGKPTQPVILLKGPTQPRNTQGGVEFRFACRNKQLMLALRDFSKWLLAEKFSVGQVRASLMKLYDGNVGRLQLLSGWVHNPGREDCLILNVNPHTPLGTFMLEPCSPELRKEILDSVPPPPAAPTTSYQPSVPEVDEDSGPAPGHYTTDADHGLQVDSNGLATAASVAALVRGATRA